MGLEAGEQGAKERQNDIDHELPTVDPEHREIEVSEGLRDFRYPQVVVMPSTSHQAHLKGTVSSIL